ncbi:MAG: DEAD/DEAH box helicase [Mycobacterium leprae]
MIIDTLPDVRADEHRIGDTGAGFAAMPIHEAILKSLDEMGFEEPSPIQAEAIPLLLEGKDLIGQAQTGTGKTAAYAIPLLQRLKPDVQRPQGLVLAPTRELALQVAEEIGRIGKYMNVRELAVYGGSPIDRQIRALRAGVSLVIGTPGRLLDHINRGTIKLDQVHTLVLDESDEMLDMGFIDDIETIIRHLPEERQTVCFSATMPDPILRLTRRYMNEPVRVTIAAKELTAATIEQAYFEIRERDRIDALTRIIDHEAIARAIIFCRTKRSCDEVSSALQARGYMAEAIHGDLNQAQRNRTLARFKEGQIELLVATDVAARGLDVENVTHVINYDIAQSPEAHVHRIGRTGRAGREGTAFTLIHPREFRQLKFIERQTKGRIPRRNVPTATDVAERAQELMEERIGTMVNQPNPALQYAEMAGRLLEEHDPQRLVAALLATMMESRGGSVAEEAPRRAAPTGQFPETGAEPGYVRLFFNIGSRDRVSPADFVRTIAREADIPGGLIGAIDIHDAFTFVEVPRDVGAQVMEAMRSASIHGRNINVEPARPSGH